MNVVFGNIAISYDDYAASYAETPRFRIAIPSYKRSDIIQEKTLSLLHELGVSNSIIDIFVQSNDDYANYMSVIPKHLYGRIIMRPGTRLKDQRNNIRDFYSEGDRIVEMDDDISSIFCINKENKKQNVRNISALFDYAFDICENIGTRFWGIYAAANTMFMKHQIGLGLRFIVGCLWGTIITKDNRMTTETDEKEDYERSIKCYLTYGNVVRLDFVSVITSFYKTKGGMQEYRTITDSYRSVDKFIRKYPFLVRKHKTKKETAEILLVEQREAYKKHSKRKLTFM